MAPVGGKRKRRASLDKETAEIVTLGERDRLGKLHKALQHHFESSFTPLPQLSIAQEPDEEQTKEDDGSSSDWEGLSDLDLEPAEIVHHDPAGNRTEGLPRHEHKMFMVG